MGEYLDIEIAAGRAMKAFIERPAVKSAPVVIVLHEVFGVNDDMRASCRELAERGFIAIAPELFWRQEPGVDLSHWTEAEWKKGLALYTAYDRDQGVRDLKEVVRFARTLAGATGKVGVKGYCLGGLMTFLVNARIGVDAAVAYYPGSAEQYVDEARNVDSPMLIHLAEQDEFISTQAQRDIRTAFDKNPNVRTHSYPGCSHAFARHSGVHYDAAAANTANTRTWEFLTASLT